MTYFLERERRSKRERNLFHHWFTPPNAHKAKCFIQVSHMSCKSPRTWTVLYCLSQACSRKLRQEVEHLGHKPNPTGMLDTQVAALTSKTQYQSLVCDTVDIAVLWQGSPNISTLEQHHSLASSLKRCHPVGSSRNTELDPVCSAVWFHVSAPCGRLMWKPEWQGSYVTYSLWA